MALPLKLPWEQAQTRWKSEIDPLLSNQLTQGRLLTNVSVSDQEVTVINHGLGRKLVGWMIVGTPSSSPAIVWDAQSLNQYPELTLNLTNLNGLGTVVVNLWVF